MEPFIKKCKESVWKYEKMWEDFSGSVGFWADMENPYVTYHDDYIESEWWALSELWKKGLLYKGFKIVPYCPRCGTPLSSAEVSQGYKTVKERSAIARFKVKGEENTYFLVWTTTPWTLPSNVALCVNPEETYVKVRVEADGCDYILAEALVGSVIKAEGENAAPVVLERFAGRDLEYREYEPLFGFTGEFVAKNRSEKAFYVTCDTYVTMTDGTGIVHIAPAFGEDDANVGRKYGLPFVQFVNGKGEMTAETDYAGLFVKKADHPGRPEEGRSPLQRAEVRARVSALLALRYAPHLLRPRLLVHPRKQLQGRPRCQQQYGQLAARIDRQRPLRQLAGEHPGLGHFEKPLLGHAPEYLGMQLRPPRMHRQPEGTRRAERQ